MEKKNKSYLIKFILIIFVVYITLFGVNKYFKSKTLNSPLPEVKLKEKIKKEKTFAIMVSDDGSNYQKYESNEWPNDKYKFKEAKCLDNKGNLIDDVITFENGKVTIKTDKTIYCTLYFDHKETIKILRENDINGNISPEPNQGEMYRYQGTDNVANWICFGTEDNCGTNDDLIDKYMYRIIGITPNGELYLIKETFLKEGDVTGFAWNDKYETSGEYEYTCDDKICPEWGQNTLFKRLNGTSNGGTKGIGSCYQLCDGANTDIFIDSEYYDYLKSGDKINGENTSSKWYNLIAEHNWLYGDTTQTYYNGNQMYAIETGKADATHYVGIDEDYTLETYKWNKSIKAKISLMYLYDYVYSYYDGETEESRGNPKDFSTAKNGWIFFQKDGYNISQSYEWLSTRFGIYIFFSSFKYVDPRSVYSDGSLNGVYFSGHGYGVRPVFYLSSKAKIVEGDGTKDSPFILSGI